MSWFKRIKEGITTDTEDKKETPEGLWYKCSSCKHIMTTEDHEKNFWVCEKCGNHHRIGSHEYFDILFDGQEFTEINAGIKSGDPLNFADTKKNIPTG